MDSVCVLPCGGTKMAEIDPRIDVVFKNLFGSTEHPRLTKSFVNSLLATVGLPKAVHLEILNPFQLADFVDQKESELDIMYEDESGRQVQLEMQIVKHSGLPQRMIHNWSQIYQRQLLKGNEYIEHLPVVSIWILDDILWHDDEWLHVFLCQDEESGQILHGDQCIVTMELPVWSKWIKEQKSSIMDLSGKWLYFLTNAKAMDDRQLLVTLDDPEFKEAVEVMAGYTTEQKRRHAYDMRENYQRILASFKRTGYDEGKSEGKAEGKAEIALSMKTKGFTAEQIAEITGLGLKEIEAL
jgi:predicted transposase/invertase (TIGR01784 family)